MKVPRRTSILPILFMLFLLLFPRVTRSGQQEAQIMSLHVTTSAFPSEGTIPKKFTCDGPDVSPPLAWGGAPPGTQSFALILDDPDAPVGTWVHWVLYDLPANTKELAEGVPKQEKLANGARQGRNDFRKIGYGGPRPPPGKPPRCFFERYTLGTRLQIKQTSSQREAESAMKGHILAQAELMGRYGR